MIEDYEPAFADVHLTPRATGAARPNMVTADELQQMQFPPIRYVVPGYIVEGCTLLAGAPKIGKSWLVLDIALAKSSGSVCLGSIETGDAEDVLYLALEDNLRRLQSRMEKLFIDRDRWPARLTFVTEWPRADAGGLDRIRLWAKSKERPRLVIVDVLTMFRPKASGKDSTYEHDYNSIKSLQALAAELHVAIIIVHHTRKSRDQVDPFDRVSGTLGLSGAADTVLILDRDGQGVTLYGRGRDITEIETVVTFNRDLCRWSITGPAAEARLSNERLVIVQTLLVTSEPMSPAEIADAVRMNRNSVKQLLFKMLTAGTVLKVGKGKYIHPDRVDLQNP